MFLHNLELSISLRVGHYPNQTQLGSTKFNTLVCTTVVFHWSLASNIVDSLAVLNSSAFCKVSRILRFDNSLAYVIVGWKSVCNLRGRISISFPFKSFIML